MLYLVVEFETFVDQRASSLRVALVSAYGSEAGLDAAAEAMAYGFEHWDRLSAMANPSGYLYRVGQTAARRARRIPPLLPAPPPATIPELDPGLVPALDELSEAQRTCVLLVHAFGVSIVETAELLEIDESTVRTHVRRAMKRLKTALEVESDVG